MLRIAAEKLKALNKRYTWRVNPGVYPPIYKALYETEYYKSLGFAVYWRRWDPGIQLSCKGLDGDTFEADLFIRKQPGGYRCRKRRFNHLSEAEDRIQAYFLLAIPNAGVSGITRSFGKITRVEEGEAIGWQWEGTRQCLPKKELCVPEYVRQWVSKNGYGLGWQPAPAA